MAIMLIVNEDDRAKRQALAAPLMEWVESVREELGALRAVASQQMSEIEDGAGGWRPMTAAEKQAAYRKRKPPPRSVTLGNALGNSSVTLGNADKPKRRRSKAVEAPIPDDWKPTPEHIAYAKLHGLNLRFEVDAFLGHYDGRKVASANGRFRTWLANQAKWKAERGTGQHRNGKPDPTGIRATNRLPPLPRPT